MQLSEFDFELPEELIAKYPLEKRDESRMLYYSQGKLEHKQFKDIVDILQPGDVLVRNVSKVLAARLWVWADTGAKIEILLTEKISDHEWQAIAGNSKRIKAGRKYKLSNGIEVSIQRHDENILVDFGSLENYEKAIQDCGSMPIPPYMKREAEESDKLRYQTTYARDTGDGASVAAPTAGLHFTPEIDEALKTKGIEILELTLHVGLGTFMPIKTENIADHKMHAEIYSISEDVWNKIQTAKKQGRRIIAVGSTSTRVLESVAAQSLFEKFPDARHASSEDTELTETSMSSPRNEHNNADGTLRIGSTDIYIYPGFKFQVINGMLTNFHLPKSSLMLLISALLGTETVHKIYQEAINSKYRFYSYGDCCLFL